MKNRALISYLFSFLLLAVLSLQLMEQFDQLLEDQPTVELLQSDEEPESEFEEDSESIVLFITPQAITATCFSFHQPALNTTVVDVSQYLLSIPSPPPELA